MEILKTTEKALQLSEDGVSYWIQRRWLRADNSLTPKGEAARAAAIAGDGKNKRPFFKVKFRSIRDVSEKAVFVECFDGSGDFLPKSQIRDCIIEDALWVPCWLAEQKNLQFGEKKMWLEVDR
jgi:hypothetical protein